MPAGLETSKRKCPRPADGEKASSIPENAKTTALSGAEARANANTQGTRSDQTRLRQTFPRV
jgi:hypothetical protein